MEGYSTRNTKSESTSKEEARSTRNKLSATDLKLTEEYSPHIEIMDNCFQKHNVVKRNHKQSKLIPAFKNPPQSFQNRCLIYLTNIGTI